MTQTKRNSNRQRQSRAHSALHKRLEKGGVREVSLQCLASWCVKEKKYTGLHLSRTGYHGKVAWEEQEWIKWGSARSTLQSPYLGSIQEWILFRQAVGWPRLWSSGVDIGTVTVSRTGRAHCWLRNYSQTRYAHHYPPRTTTKKKKPFQGLFALIPLPTLPHPQQTTGKLLALLRVWDNKKSIWQKGQDTVIHLHDLQCPALSLVLKAPITLWMFSSGTCKTSGGWRLGKYYSHAEPVRITVVVNLFAYNGVTLGGTVWNVF